MCMLVYIFVTRWALHDILFRLVYLVVGERYVRLNYTTLTNFSTKYLMMCKVYTDVGGIN